MADFPESEAWGVAVQLQDDPAGEEKLYGAVRQASEEGNRELEAEALGALGMLYYFHGNDEAAQRSLEAALRIMPGGHPDGVAAEAVMEAIRTGEPVGAPGEEVAMAGEIRRFVLERLQPGLVSRLGVRVSEVGGVSWDIEVTRELSTSEARQMNAVIDEALGFFQEM